ncbi:hypothetical protein [Myroides sp. WP-1]|uniref:hypothetical protein n=1 Tax=Myroides sp. WP-1 TaxID=2759944 RepID=UPI0015F86462|nr:hypothetical protein [Myroides sp. WP-1]MBB1139773.1 hypothetical protein [Myroides sp. WP-1]
MKKTVLTLSLFALSTVSFAGCFTLNYSCGGGTTYCPQEHDTITDIMEDIDHIEAYVCGA